MTIKIFDIKATTFSKIRAKKKWNKHNFIFKKVSYILIEKILEIKKDFKRILLITSDLNETILKLDDLKYEELIILSESKEFQNISKRKEKKKLVGSVFSNTLNVKFDLIISNLCLHRVDEVVLYGSKIMNLLESNGLFICSYFGGKTLIELRDSLIRTDQERNLGSYQRIIPYIDMIDATNIFSKVGFKEIVSDKVTLRIKYKKVEDLLNDIKGMGENNNLLSRYKGMTTKSFIDRLEYYYRKKYQDLEQRLTTTCDIIFLSMWKN